MKEHSTVLPTCGMLSEKPEWEVRKAGRYAWYARRKGKLPDVNGFFPTWGEALAYADQKARQVTVTLPPLDPAGAHRIGGKGIYSLWVDHTHPLTHIYLGGWDGIGIESQDLEGLALYLLALAKQKERPCHSSCSHSS